MFLRIYRRALVRHADETGWRNAGGPENRRAPAGNTPTTVFLGPQLSWASKNSRIRVSPTGYWVGKAEVIMNLLSMPIASPGGIASVEIG
jgi:hypothetical protein